VNKVVERTERDHIGARFLSPSAFLCYCKERFDFFFSSFLFFHGLHCYEQQNDVITCSKLKRNNEPVGELFDRKLFHSFSLIVHYFKDNPALRMYDSASFPFVA